MHDEVKSRNQIPWNLSYGHCVRVMGIPPILLELDLWTLCSTVRVVGIPPNPLKLDLWTLCTTASVVGIPPNPLEEQLVLFLSTDLSLQANSQKIIWPNIFKDK